jgi:hypothetical protein
MESAAFNLGPFMAMVLMLSLLGLFVLTLVKAITTRSGGWIAGAVISGVLSLGLVGGGMVVAAKAFRDAVNGRNEGVKRVASDDNTVSLEVPKSWKPHPGLNPESVLSFSNPLREQYVIVIREGREDFDGKLEDYARLVESNMASAIGDTKGGGLQSVTIGTQPALQRILRGRVDKVNIAFLLTCVETEDAFCQVLTWTLASREQNGMPVLKKVVDSFQGGTRAKLRQPAN